MLSLIPLALLISTVRLCLAVSSVNASCGAAATFQTDPGGVDPHDETTLGIWLEFVPCEAPILAMTVTYTGQDNVATTETSTASYSTSSPYASTFVTTTYSFTGAETSIQSGSQVTISANLLFPNGEHARSGTPISFPYSPVVSNYFIEATETGTETFTTEITKTTRTEVTITVAAPQKTKTSDCTTLTSTSTAPPKIITSTSTFTLEGTKTIIKTVTSTTTKHTSCIPKSSTTTRAALIKKREVPAGYAETPYFPGDFGPPVNTTYTTSYTYTFVSSTSTITTTDTRTLTKTVQTRPTPRVTTVCETASTTITTTPTSTTTTTIGVDHTVTSTRTKVITTTVYPKSAKPCKTTGAQAAVKFLKSPDGVLVGG